MQKTEKSEKILRNETKFITTSLAESMFMLQSIGVRECFPQRKVSSIYFDTQSYNCFFDGEEGSVPRSKFRFRVYDTDLKTLSEKDQVSGTFEIKQTFPVGRSKSKWFSKNQNIRNLSSDAKEIFNNQQLMPLVYISYDRKYFIHNNSKITVDFNMTASKVGEDRNFRNNFYDFRSVIEIKENLNEHIRLTDFLPHQKRRFSKYCEFLKNLNICRS